MEADIQAALDRNYTLLINRQKLGNALDAANKENIQNQIAGNERQIRVSVTRARESLETAKQAYELAVSNRKAKEQAADIAARKWQAGILTSYEYEEAAAALREQERAVQIAYLDVAEALEAYRWSVNGLANAE